MWKMEGFIDIDDWNCNNKIFNGGKIVVVNDVIERRGLLS